MDGFLIIDKPAGLTSFGVIREVRRITGVKKIGHAGTLDPMATGVLVLALGKATKQLAGLIKHDKEYSAEILFGVVSDTYDREGKMEWGVNNELRIMNNGLDGRSKFEDRSSKMEDQKLTEELIENALKDFVGEIEQMPPVYSALKIGGKRACDIVRGGGTVELKTRKVMVYELGIMNYELRIMNKGLDRSSKFGVRGSKMENQESMIKNQKSGIKDQKKFIDSIYQNLPAINLKIHCGSGFYVRSLAHDLGQKLGCGAVLWNLRRTRVGEFGIEEAVGLEEMNQENWQGFLKELKV